MVTCGRAGVTAILIRPQAAVKEPDAACGIPRLPSRVAGGMLVRMNAPLSIKDRTPLAKGGLRLVFEHPENPALLIKVMRPDAVAARYDSGRRKRRRFGAYILFVREMREFVAGWATHGRHLSIAQEITGFVETDMGLGLVTPAMRGKNGGLARTLATIVDHGEFDDGIRADLDDFLTVLIDCSLVVSDLHERNLVHAYDAATGKHRFVMIDGIGAPTVLPLKVWFPSLNRRSKVARVQRLHDRLALRETTRLEKQRGSVRS